jgi:pyridoxal phosphate enzyme (YggS family)
MAFEGLEGQLDRVRELIGEAQRGAGLAHAVRIVAVTKSHGAEAVAAARRAGLSDVGENRVQEALAKQAASPDGMNWHLIGTLQRNKARHAVGRFLLIHSVDRLDLATELARRVPGGERQQVLVQVNCSGEPQKGGVEPGGLAALLEGVAGLPALDLRGLMTMAAYDADEGTQRRTFGLLRELRERSEASGHRLPELSMGMSDDFESAVREGATMVRLGTVLFGGRG